MCGSAEVHEGARFLEICRRMCVKRLVTEGIDNDVERIGSVFLLEKFVDGGMELIIHNLVSDQNVNSRL